MLTFFSRVVVSLFLPLFLFFSLRQVRREQAPPQDGIPRRGPRGRGAALLEQAGRVPLGGPQGAEAGQRVLRDDFPHVSSFVFLLQLLTYSPFASPAPVLHHD